VPGSFIVIGRAIGCLRGSHLETTRGNGNHQHAGCVREFLWPCPALARKVRGSPVPFLLFILHPAIAWQRVSRSRKPTILYSAASSGFYRGVLRVSLAGLKHEVTGSVLRLSRELREGDVMAGRILNADLARPVERGALRQIDFGTLDGSLYGVDILDFDVQKRGPLSGG